MKRETISQALNGIDERYIDEAAVFRPAALQNSPERSAGVKTKRIITIALAAALILALGAAAYASDIFGIKTMVKEPVIPANIQTEHTDISLSQPQAVEDSVDAAIREKVDNSAKAWAEWNEWRQANTIQEPEVFANYPEGASESSLEENGDGSYTLIFYTYETVYDENGEPSIESKQIELERRAVTAEEYEQLRAFYEMSGQKVPYGDYDFNYDACSAEEAEKLESIAASYGLNLRRGSTSVYQDYGENPDFNTREELIEKVNEICAGGKSFFRTKPFGFDKFYFYDEGSFGISYAVEETLWQGTTVYIYNSPYSTLSSGDEVSGTLLNDISTFTTRSHISPDGTELTVMQSGGEVYAYVYLENSYLALHVHSFDGLTEAEADAVLDMVDYSTIG